MLCKNLISSQSKRSILSLRSLSTHRQDPRNTPISKADFQTLTLAQYRRGKFLNLLQSVVSEPSVLLAAARNLASSDVVPASNTFSGIDALSADLRANRFDVESCCVRLAANRKKGEPLVLPNLKLKVVIESIRMVLEVIYESRFATFSYGARVGMGRHTAVRYLKNSVQNPNWWFRVEFHRKRFELCHVRKLASILAEKIEDQALMEVMHKFFEFNALGFEFGGCCFGRGFPQVSSLCELLVNIYLNGLDQMIQDLRLKIDHKNLNFDANDNLGRPHVFHKPVKLFSVRYLDEILVITSGSKLMTMNLKDQVVRYLEGNLELKVNRLGTSIHSATSEKMDFLGMEFQAVPPTVLHPPMSDKAIRAMKKHIKRKEMRALELRNARETRRKKLGLKILNHVYKKLKRCDEFKFDIQIEDEVQAIFRGWAQEVVQDFFGSPEECYNWHRKLLSGDFLSIKAIRDQMPPELVNAYDEFEEKVDEFMNLERARKVLEEEDKEEEEESLEYAKRTVDELTKLCIKVDAPMELIRKTVKLAGFTNSMGRPRPIKLLIALDDTEIVKWYAGVGRRWLEFFCCCHNFRQVKTIVSYHLRFSCILTLAEKHESMKREAIKHYTKDLKVAAKSGMEEWYFPTEREIKMMGDRNLSDPKPVDGSLCMALLRLASDEMSSQCGAHFCDRMDAAFYRIRLLQNRLNLDPLDQKRWVPRLGVIHESLNRKCIPLCSKHASDLYLGCISLQDVDYSSCVDLQ
ncbi:hypothetical protein ACLOJK_009007 [Asimina triloba]